VEVGRYKRVSCGGGADSMLQFRFERGGGGIKCCQKMKRRQRARLAQWEGSVTRRSGVITSARGEVAPGRKNGGDDVS
jgi:hypothetical protein